MDENPYRAPQAHDEMTAVRSGERIPLRIAMTDAALIAIGYLVLLFFS
jgi:hypothetical protein